MKKIFLLSLLSVLFFSAFSQNSGGSTEILAQINIIRSTAADDPAAVEDDLSIQLSPGWPFWWFLYQRIYTEFYPGGVMIRCEGIGWKLCYLHFRDLFNNRGIDPEQAEATCQNMVEESDQLVTHGVYQGSLTRKFALSNLEMNGRTNYIFYQLNWNYDPKQPRSGEAEIIISKTNNLGF
jgi:hypothetical protein